MRRNERQWSGVSAGEPAAGKMFGKHSYGLRGVVGAVDIPGEIRAGDRVKLEVPR